MLGVHASAQAIIHFGKIAPETQLIKCVSGLTFTYSHPSQLWIASRRSRVPMNLPLPSLQLMTDASLSKWSGILFHQDRRISGNWTPEDLTQSVNWLELKAISLSLHNFLPLLQGQLVLLLSDSTTSVACIRNQGTLRSEPLIILSAQIFNFCHIHSITLVPKHLSGVLNVFGRFAPKLTNKKCFFQKKKKILDLDFFTYFLLISTPDLKSHSVRQTSKISKTLFSP